jgi:hypothetical protein
LKLIKITLVVLLFTLFFNSCTKQDRIKNFGEEGVLDLPAGKKLVNLTWKESDMWILVRDMKEGETPEVYIFYDESSYGLMSGKYTVKEQALLDGDNKSKILIPGVFGDTIVRFDNLK